MLYKQQHHLTVASVLDRPRLCRPPPSTTLIPIIDGVDMGLLKFSRPFEAGAVGSLSGLLGAELPSPLPPLPPLPPLSTLV